MNDDSLKYKSPSPVTTTPSTRPSSPFLPLLFLSKPSSPPHPNTKPPFPLSSSNPHAPTHSTPSNRPHTHSPSSIPPTPPPTAQTQQHTPSTPSCSPSPSPSHPYTTLSRPMKPPLRSPALKAGVVALYCFWADGRGAGTASGLAIGRTGRLRRGRLRVVRGQGVVGVRRLAPRL